ncbi:MAG: 2-succinyl-5-enolpyruvyl-6-hydroxy-3-cyclohexene-1-carboxylic-acid synthase [Egibacteraceae bacterium]
MNPATALAGALVEGLASRGLTDACLSPGARSAPLALALLAQPRVRLHVRIDERSAAFAALGIAKVSRRPVAVACTSGTAAANLHPAVLEAHEARVPLIVLTADRPPELRGTGANQTVDQVKLYGSAVRWFCEVGAPELGQDTYWRSLAARAWSEASGALGGPPGPVHLNVALREPLLPSGACRVSTGFRSPADTPRLRGAPARADVEWLAERVGRSERGMLVAGDCDLADSRSLLRLAEAAGWPVLAEPTSGLRAGPNAISTAHHLLATEPFAQDHRPDLLVVVGKIGLSRAVLALLGGEAPQVLLDPHGAWLDPARVTPRVVVGDPTLTACEVAARLPQRPAPGWLDSWRDAEAKARAALDGLLDLGDEPSEPRTARDLAALVPDGGLLVAASSMPIRDLNLAMAPRAGLRIIGNRGASGIDGFTSTAVGAALAHDGPTVALAGDLSLLHDQNGLVIGPGEPRPDLAIVVVNNDGGGIFSLLPGMSGQPGFERLFATPHGVDLAHLAKATGCGHRLVERAADLPAALDGAGLRLVEIRTDRAANARLHQRLQDAVSAAVG